VWADLFVILGLHILLLIERLLEKRVERFNLAVIAGVRLGVGLYQHPLSRDVLG
jgi:hypothetical protein